MPKHYTQRRNKPSNMENKPMWNADNKRRGSNPKFLTLFSIDCTNEEDKEK